MHSYLLPSLSLSSSFLKQSHTHQLCNVRHEISSVFMSVRPCCVVQEESQSTPALLTSGNSVIANSAASLALIPEHSLLESCARLSVSLEGPGLYNVPGSSTTSCSSTRSSRSNSHHMTLEELEELRNVNRYAESTKSLSYLPQVGRNILKARARLIRHFTTI